MGIRGLQPQTTIPSCNFTVGIMHSIRWDSPGICQTQIHPSDCQMPLLQSPVAAQFTPFQPMLGIAHRDLRLVCSCLAMETHFMKLQTHSSWCCFQRQFGTLYWVMQQMMGNFHVLCASTSTRQLHSMNLRGLLLCGWGAVVPRHFCFTVLALTFLTRAGLAWQEWFMAKVASYYSARFKVTKLFNRIAETPQ